MPTCLSSFESIGCPHHRQLRRTGAWRSCLFSGWVNLDQTIPAVAVLGPAWFLSAIPREGSAQLRVVRMPDFHNSVSKPPIQNRQCSFLVFFGLNSKGVTEYIVCKLRRVLDSFALQIDVRNAFNCADRSTMLRDVATFCFETKQLHNFYASTCHFIKQHNSELKKRSHIFDPSKAF